MGASSSAPTVTLDGSKTVSVGGVEYPTFNDEHFGRIREHFQLSSTFDAQFSFKLKAQGGNMSEGGGKGGNLMGFTADRHYILKELNDTDHKTLLLVASDLANHLTHADGSLLSKIVAHFYHPTKKSNYMIMNNVVPAIKTSQGSEKSHAKRRASYDLKGCNDDKTLEQDGERLEEVHKRIWQLHLWCGTCCWSRQRHVYFAGKRAAYAERFHVTPAQKDHLMQWLRTSVHFLAERRLMDYSLMVSAVALPEADPLTRTVLAHVEANRAADHNNPFPFVSSMDGNVQILHIGVIDFLQDWTCTKNLAMAVKVCERNKATVPPDEYGARFIRHFTDNIVGDAAPCGILHSQSDLQSALMER